VFRIFVVASSSGSKQYDLLKCHAQPECALNIKGNFHSDKHYIEGTVPPQTNLEDHHTVNNKYSCVEYISSMWILFSGQKTSTYIKVNSQLWESPQPPNNESPQLITSKFPPLFITQSIKTLHL